MNEHPTPNEARIAIRDLGRRGYWEYDPKATHTSAAASLVHQIESLAIVQGLSGEDKYALLAYHALRCSDRYAALALEQLSLTPAPGELRDWMRHDRKPPAAL